MPSAKKDTRRGSGRAHRSPGGLGVVTRYLERAISDDALADGKMAFISGPRQVGKTTLGLALLTSKDNLYTWDDQRFRQRWVKDPVASIDDRLEGPVLLDEIHKDRRWKSRLKGLYDLRGARIPLVVTGSARLDLFRRGGDSLMGRYVPYRLHPLSAGEKPQPPGLERALEGGVSTYAWDDLMNLGTFPEPLLGGNERKARRWSRLRRDRLIYEDVRDLRQIRDIQALRVLIDLLPERVGSLLSVNSLREDVGVAYATARDWIFMLEALYHCFLLRPYGGRLKRTLKADPKLYLYDVLELEDAGKRRENLAALHLLKACHYYTDLGYGDLELGFLRTKEKEEVDFVVTRDKAPWLMVECKSGQTSPSKTLVKYKKKLAFAEAVQLVDRRGFERRYPELGVRIVDYERFFAGMV